ncbi:MAG TPA: hypothetical protein PL065_21175, partial [Polyangiaceae bacterium]|nr:hypothetical protein [Polyangiaceae bacterium]
EQGEAQTNCSAPIPSRFDESVTPLSHSPWPGLHSQDVGGLAGGKIDVSGKLLEGLVGGGAKLSVSRGSFSFEPDVDLGIKIKWFKVEEFHVVLSGDMALELALLLETSLSTSQTWKGNFFKLEKPLPPLMIGPVPVVVTMVFTVSGGAEFSVSDKQTVEAGAGAKSSVALGGRYKKGSGWSKVSESSFHLYPIGPTIESATTVSVKGFIPKVEIAFLLYDAVGPTMNVSPYAKLDVNVTPPCPWKITAGVEGNFGAKVQVPVIGYTLASTSFKLFDVNGNVADGQLPAWICGVDGGVEAGLGGAGGGGGSGGTGGTAGSGGASQGGSGGGSGGVGATGGSGGFSGSEADQTCGELGNAKGWGNLYCERNGNGACQGKGPATSDCDHCCTGTPCVKVVEANGWTSLRCEVNGNGVCGGTGVPTFDCDYCCGSTCTYDDDCDGKICAWDGFKYCCRSPGAQGKTCFSDGECGADEVCAWNGEKFVCSTPECTDS